jgi:hypothetical protein
MLHLPYAEKGAPLCPSRIEPGPGELRSLVEQIALGDEARG